MRRFWVLAALWPLVVACGRDWESFRVEGSDGGGGTAGTGSGGFSGGACFPGAKACPDAKTGELVCLTADTPTTGCKSSSACEPCVTPHATAKCSGGLCSIDKCDAGFADCNSDAKDGCEADVANDPTHCGSCTTDCIASKGPNWVCSAGQCAVNDCSPSTTADCDGNKTNGCEVDLLTDVNDCGYCKHACNLSHATSICKASSSGTSIADCAVGQCDAGWANCDGNDANGCEVNVANDSANCGACGAACSTTNGLGGCTAGTCGILCNAGYGNCDGDATNGCEVSLLNDPAHCSACTTQCVLQNVTAPTCSSGVCGYTTCTAGFANCDGNATNGCELDTQTDTQNCGACGNNCNPATGGSAVCNGGVCGQTCSSPLILCAGACVNTTNDANNCSSCGHTCYAQTNATAICKNSACSFTCNTGYTNCQGTCYDLLTSKNHCGSCFNSCFGTKVCTNGHCG